jgi:Transposase IS66 family
LTRLRTLAATAEQWAERIAQVKHMRSWVVEAEHILDGGWATAEDVVNNEHVGQRFDQWSTRLTQHLSDAPLSEVQQKCLQELLQVLCNVRPYLIQCYDHPTFPRTNNDTEREIRGIKTRYRRISGRKNWNSYLLRYGRCVAFYEWWEHEPDRCSQLEGYLRRVTPEHWKDLRQQTTGAQSEQLKRFRFRCKRTTSLSSLEIRWEATAQSALLP